MEKNPEPWVDVKRLAEHWAQTPRWIRHHAPLIPHVRAGKEYRFRISEADAWIEQWRGGEQP